MSLSCEIPSEYCPHGVNKTVLCDKCAVQHRLNMLEIKSSELERIINAIKESYNNLCAPSLRKEPFKCPVCDGLKNCNKCDGMGKFFTGNGAGNMAVCTFCKGNPICNICDGKGIIWG